MKGGGGSGGATSGLLTATAASVLREDALRKSPPKLFFLGLDFRMLPLPELFWRW
jgi:hypothetical protein